MAQGLLPIKQSTCGSTKAPVVGFVVVISIHFREYVAGWWGFF
jgi:hypothetical protein